MTVSRQATGDTTNLPFIQYSQRVQRDSGNTNTGIIYNLQNFESINSIPFAGRTVTFSFYARAGANYSSASSALSYGVSTGTGTDQNLLNGYTGQASPISSTATLTTTWQRFTATATLSASATQIGIGFNYTPVGTAGANDWFEFTGVQLEVGSVATPFKTYAGTIQGELAACQRYYFKHPASGNTNSPISMGSYYTSSNVGTIVPFPVVMRVAPTLAVTSGTDYYLAVRNGGLDGVNSFTQDGANTLAATIYNNSEASGTAGQATLIISNNASSSIAWSAEL
jgi:hypothetical protein